MTNPRDYRLLNYVKREIRLGKTHIRIPSQLLEGTSELARQDVRDLCKINKVKITITV